MSLSPQMVALGKKLRTLIGIRVLVFFSTALPYYLYRISEHLEQVASGQAAIDIGADTATGLLRQATQFLAAIFTAQDPYGQVLQSLVAVVSLQTLLYISLQRLLAGRPLIQAYVQMGGDLLLVTMLVYQLGNSYSLLYLIVIIVASVLLRRLEVMVVGGVAFLLYALVAATGILRSVQEVTWLKPLLTQQHPPQLADAALTYNLIIHFLGFFAVSLLTSYLSRSAARAEAEAEAAGHDLAHLQVLHRDVVHSISSGLVTTDLEGLVTSVNRTGCKILGQREENLVGRHIRHTGLFSNESWRQRTQEATQLYGERSDTEIVRAGEVVYIGFNLSPLSGTGGATRGYILNFQDVTARRGMEEELRTRDRMAAVGEMAAGLAHEVGNPLAAISGSVQMLAGSIQGTPPQTKLLEITLKESQRLDRTVKQFLKFARPRKPDRVPFDIVVLILEAVELLSNSAEVTPQHGIEADLVPSSAMVCADPDQIRQIFWNLARNALHAMPDGGRLSIQGRLEEESYRLHFRDTGSGMNAEEKANLFHPFQSFFDGGTGIGMAIVYRIVEDHGGKIHADSRPGEGTTITVDLPLGPIPATALEGSK